MSRWWIVGILLLLSSVNADTAELRKLHTFNLNQQEVESTETSQSPEEGTTTPGLGAPVTSGPGVGDVKLSSGNPWLDDAGIDAKWNGPLLEMRANQERAKIQKEIEQVQQQLLDTQLEKIRVTNRLQEIDVIRGESDVLSIPEHKEEPEGDGCDDTPSASGNPTEFDMAAEAIPNPQKNLEPPRPSRTHGQHQFVENIIHVPEPWEMAGEQDPGRAHTDAVDIAEPMTVSAFSEAFGTTGDHFDMQRRSTTLDGLATVVSTASEAAKSILNDNAVAPVFSFKDQTTDLNERAVWAVMNDKDEKSTGAIEAEEPIPEDVLTGHPKPVPATQEPPIAKGPEFSPEDISGCCFHVKLEWINDNSQLTSKYEGEDGVKAAICRTTKDAKMLHVPGAMCVDVKAQFENINQVTYNEQDAATMKKFLAFLMQYATIPSIEPPPEIIPGQVVVPEVDDHSLNELPMHERMNLPIYNGAIAVPPPRDQPRKLIPSIVEDDGLFAKVSGFLPELELTPVSVREERTGFVMPDTEAKRAIDAATFRTTPLVNAEEETNVLQPEVSIDLHKRVNAKRLAPFVAPNDNSDDHHMPEPVQTRLRADCNHLAPPRK